MPAIIRHAKSLYTILMIATFFWSMTAISFAEDFSPPHIISPGDVISADVMNELFEAIQEAGKTIGSADILGTWSCTTTQIYGSSHLGVSPAGLTSDPDNLYEYRSDNVTFVNDGDGTYSLSTENIDVIYLDEQEFFEYALYADYTIHKNVLYLRVTSSGTPNLAMFTLPMATVRYSINMIADTRFELRTLRLQGETTARCQTICDKLELPPAQPTNLRASSSELTVTLAWTDNSSDETGFKIMRRDTLEGNYTQIAITAADITSYEDTVPAVGKYWYRVIASNANGDSVGSNVVKVEESQ